MKLKKGETITIRYTSQLIHVEASKGREKDKIVSTYYFEPNVVSVPESFLKSLILEVRSGKIFRGQRRKTERNRNGINTISALHK